MEWSTEESDQYFPADYEAKASLSCCLSMDHLQRAILEPLATVNFCTSNETCIALRCLSSYDGFLIAGIKLVLRLFRHPFSRSIDPRPCD